VSQTSLGVEPRSVEGHPLHWSTSFYVRKPVGWLVDQAPRCLTRHVRGVQ